MMMMMMMMMEERMEKFGNKILELDAKAEMHPTDPKKVCCLGCGQFLVMQEAYTTQHFKKHKTQCKPFKKVLSGVGMSTLSIYFEKKEDIKEKPQPNDPDTLPCAGL